ncbi:lateral signaling target protein 2 homolog isoform X1 [Lytechinus variegatus]|uniref:lateral signaling target protein 2 homolog isoform X1 n=1 Tax=Lytechinus variegatus TaxID=7654 RepID=UPI001BB240CA|nr:lateral signaling target protein 2 homolog isoform X1 [Lytechinus variegatus]
MLALRKWFYKPKKNDSQLLAQFYYADEELNSVSHELDSFDGRQDPDRCTVLVNQLRICQDKVLGIIEQLMNEAIAEGRASRDFRAKFPDDVLQDSLAGQLWFGAECLAAGSTIMNREIESAALRPLARCLTRSLDCLRAVLRDQSYKNLNSYPQKVKEALKKFDHVFAEFELSYVSAMVPVKSALEYDTMQDVIVLFCETINRALSKKLFTQDQIDDYDPGLMFTIPRLAIVSGLVTFSDGPLNMAKPASQISELFRPFQNLLIKISELLQTLSEEELHLLERGLCSSKESWEDIERELDQLSFRDRPVHTTDSHYHDEAACRLSPCSSCVTDCDTMCSSMLSLTPEDGRVMSVRRKASDSSHRCSMEDAMDIPGAVNTESSGEFRAVRIRKCSRNSLGVTSPRMSPDSLDGFAGGESRECMKCRRNSSQPSDGGLEDSGQFHDACLASRSVDSSPRMSKRTSRHCRMSRERAASDNTSISPNRREGLSESNPRVLKREDSGLGSAPNGDLMELYLQELQTSYPLSDIATPSASPIHGSVANSKEELSDISENNMLIVEMQHSELIVPISKENNPLKSAHQSNSSRIAMDFNTSFPMFGKGKPSTELNTTGIVGNSTQRISGEPVEPTSQIPAVVSRHSDSSISIDPMVQIPTDPSIQTHVTVRPSRSEPSFRLPLFGTHPQTPHSHSGDTLPSALNRVTGSRGIVRPPVTSGSDGEDSSDLSSSPSSSSSCCSSCCSSGHAFDDGDRDTDYKWESDDSSDTNSLISETNDEQEIKMAIQAAELAARQKVRSQFRSSSDLVHRLFVCIAGVADQLQTNFASDLRSILKTVFEVSACNPLATEDSVFTSPTSSTSTANPDEQFASPPTSASNSVVSMRPDRAGSSSGSHRSVRTAEGSRQGPGSEGRERHRHRSNSSHRSRRSNYDDPPLWMPDETSDECLACRSSFTVLRRKHHCRNCGQIFCARCSANSVPLPRFGQTKPVRVCNRCYMYQVTPFQH